MSVRYILAEIRKRDGLRPDEMIEAGVETHSTLYTGNIRDHGSFLEVHQSNGAMVWIPNEQVQSIHHTLNSKR